MASGASYEVLECGHLLPLGMEPCGELIAGEVGYFTASIKNVKDTQVGDTVTGAERPAAEALPGYRPARSRWCTAAFTPRTAPSTPTCATPWRSSSSTTPSLSFEPETSAALGFGFRCGFLGMLHMEIIQERLEREFDLDLITTLPSVIYDVIAKTDGSRDHVDNPRELSRTGKDRSKLDEPYCQGVHRHAARIIVGNIMDSCARSAAAIQGHGVSGHRPWWSCTTDMPLGGDRLRLLRRAQVPHQGLRLAGLRAMGEQPVRAGQGGHPAQRRPGGRAVSSSLTGIRPIRRARRMCEKLQEHHSAPAVRGARSRPPSAARSSPARPSRAMRKDVLAKCYGGDITRKKQAAGKAEGGQKEDAQLWARYRFRPRHSWRCLNWTKSKHPQSSLLAA